MYYRHNDLPVRETNQNTGVKAPPVYNLSAANDDYAPLENTSNNWYQKLVWWHWLIAVIVLIGVALAVAYFFGSFSKKQTEFTTSTFG